jgi:hypothetical protein
MARASRDATAGTSRLIELLFVNAQTAMMATSSSSATAPVAGAIAPVRHVSHPSIWPQWMSSLVASRHGRWDFGDRSDRSACLSNGWLTTRH